MGTLFSTQRIRLYRLSFASYSLEEAAKPLCTHAVRVVFCFDASKARKGTNHFSDKKRAKLI